jgi:outer membrane protein OmpA-like peptidoglycan-associated protein
MYVVKSSAVGDPPGKIDNLRMRKEVCPPAYASGEKETSQTTGHLNPDVTEFDGRLVISDFAVNSPLVRPDTRREKPLQNALTAFERDQGLRFRISGFSDCLGKEQNNQKLRQDRAAAVFNLLGKNARSRVVSVGAAPAGTFVPGSDNGTAAGRARNRGVVIEFWRDSEAEPAPPNPPPPSRPIPDIRKQVKEWEEKVESGPMEQERIRREKQKGQFNPIPAGKNSSLVDQIRERLRSERVPDKVINELFKTARILGRFAALAALDQMSISDAAKGFVKERLKDIFSWKF